MKDLATEKETVAKAKTKTWSDQTAQVRTFSEGDKVLVLMPVSPDKLSAQWQGPYSITHSIAPVSCQIDMADKKQQGRQL